MDPATTRRDVGPTKRLGTVLESVEEIRAQVRPSSSPRTVREAAPGTVIERPATAETPVFRPTSRPPMGLLHVIDDGETVGEVIRIRDGSFIMGRVDGHLIIPHDSGMSGRHAEIVRRSNGPGWSWALRDLGSTNGTFVRASSVTLYQDQEFMIGGSLFRFDSPAPAEEPAPSSAAANATRKWEVPGRNAAPPASLVEVSNGAEVRRHLLTGGEHTLGRDAGVSSIVVDNPYVEPRHARLHRDEKGRWVVSNERSRNGLWGRVTEVAIDRGGYFQCGEQRFLFKVL